MERAEWVWNLARPMYQRALNCFGRNGLERNINGSDKIRVSPVARGTSEKYEPEVWKMLMAELRTGDTFVDVGAFIGLYTVAVGLRLRKSGRVVAFEPDSRNFSLLQEHIRLNGLESQVELNQAAVSDRSGACHFLADGSSEARLVSTDRGSTAIVNVVKLDDALRGRRVDILKIDVEGHEETVLRGAENVLGSPSLKPRVIFIEVHPFAWPSQRTGSDLLELLVAAGYRVQTIDGSPVRSIERYGEIVARIREYGTLSQAAGARSE